MRQSMDAGWDADAFDSAAGAYETICGHDDGDYEDAVVHGADLVVDGPYASAEGFTLPAPFQDGGQAAEFAEQMRADIRDEVEARDTDDEDDDPLTAERDEPATAPREFNWEALWSEFGFFGEDANGNDYVGASTLRQAIRLSEQAIRGDVGAFLNRAVDAGVLDEVRHVADSDADHVDEATMRAGYTLEVIER